MKRMNRRLTFVLSIGIMLALYTSTAKGAWDQILPANDSDDACNTSRFTCVMDGAAVRDNETGRVWERSPSTTETNWYFARLSCINKTIGGRVGWRLPSFYELMSLIDPSQATLDPAQLRIALPEGHPFLGVAPTFYWTATTVDTYPDNAYSVRMAAGDLQWNTDKKASVFKLRMWCVRGGDAGPDKY